MKIRYILALALAAAGVLCYVVGGAMSGASCDGHTALLSQIFNMKGYQLDTVDAVSTVSQGTNNADCVAQFHFHFGENKWDTRYPYNVRVSDDGKTVYISLHQ